MEGAFLLIDKPLKWTSFDVVNKIRKTLCQQLGIRKIKVGHAGTLDPLATGLVIICTGGATKKISRFQEMEKTYEAEIQLGATTPSFDLETMVDRVYPWEHINLPLVEEVLAEFKGEHEQLPPVFSAKSVHGKRAYESARRGETVELLPVRIHISKLEITHFALPHLSVRVECSKGTYIRALARDLGIALGSGAHLTGLRRTVIGPYQVKNAFAPDNFFNKLKLL
ncbi:MAG: tRNA pseudouridine(55) synthase TruB [Bacteroidetes bacterium]|nr:MAG: tRNA pseudouridine(55) synthase TruB [Bacteroidota bacterium]